MFRIRKTVRLFVTLPIVLAIHTAALAQTPGPGGFSAGANLQPESQYNLNAAKEMAPSRSPAERGAPVATATASGEQLVSIIVKLTDESLAAYTGDVPGLPATSPQATGADRLDVNSPASRMYLSYLSQQEETFTRNARSKVPAVQITHRYNVILGGVAMLVPASQVDQIASLPGVQAVYADIPLQLHTDHTPQFIGATNAWGQLGGQESAGENVIVGILDTGIWPEHPSFSDPDPSGKPYGAPPPTWHGTACEFGSVITGDVAFTCNGKLLGAQRFMTTYEAVNSLLPGEFRSARDDNGHGTHTASTAAGNGNVAASIFGVPRGLVSGIAPRARVVAYKVCGVEGCYTSDSAAAVQQAILDGVNVINFSIGGGSNPYADAASLAFLDAYAAGVFVAASAGNSGPGLDTTDHREPWVTTVAASTAERSFRTTATVISGSNQFQVSGTSVTDGIDTPTPIVNAASAPYSDTLCANNTPDGAFAGKVVICQRGDIGRAEKGFNVLQRGAVGMILYNQSPEVTDLETDNHYLPTVQIQLDEGQALLAFIAANPGATVTWPAGSATTQQGDVMASFSSRGGPNQTLGVNKPDITAPGVQILAGHSPQHVDVAGGPNGELFQAIAGTSMSSPHIAGSAALLKAMHPNWTPGQIRSAMMLTAQIFVVKEDGVTATTPFDDGAGRIDLNVAGKSPLTIDETAANYVALRDELWNANYPSLYVPVMPGSITVKRTFHNETNKQSTWIIETSAPPDVTIIVPKQLKIAAGGDASIFITILAPDVPQGEARHAAIFLKKGNELLHFPISFVRRQPQVTLQKTCDPASLARGATTSCTITATNFTFNDAEVVIADAVPSNLSLIGSSVVGAIPVGNNLGFIGTLAAAQPPNVTIGVGPSPAGYLPLSAFGVAPISGVGDETIVNFNVPSFLYGGQVYSRIGIVSNGYAVVGGGTAGDIDFLNQSLPDPTPPNNVLAPFWTDLNPGAAGALRIATLTDGADTWIILDWEGVKEFSTTRTASFQIWIGINSDAHPAEDISFTYGPVQGNGDNSLLTVGAENVFGNRGQNYYYNGTGTLPISNTTELRVITQPPEPGGTHVITFQATGKRKGAWQNCALMNSDQFQGTNIACFSGEVK